MRRVQVWDKPEGSDRMAAGEEAELLKVRSGELLAPCLACGDGQLAGLYSVSLNCTRVTGSRGLSPAAGAGSRTPGWCSW